jgi:cation transport regulator ChaB
MIDPIYVLYCTYGAGKSVGVGVSEIRVFRRHLLILLEYKKAHANRKQASKQGEARQVSASGRRSEMRKGNSNKKWSRKGNSWATNRGGIKRSIMVQYSTVCMHPCVACSHRRTYGKRSEWVYTWAPFPFDSLLFLLQPYLRYRMYLPVHPRAI